MASDETGFPDISGVSSPLASPRGRRSLRLPIFLADRLRMRTAILIRAPGGVDQVGVKGLRAGIVQRNLWHTRSERSTEGSEAKSGLPSIALWNRPIATGAHVVRHDLFERAADPEYECLGAGGSDHLEAHG